MALDVQLDRVDRVYRPGQKVTGAVIVKSDAPLQHNGINLIVEGTVQLQLSARSVGLFEAFYSSLKPLQLISLNIQVTSAGRLLAGTTELPFEFDLKPTTHNDSVLYDTYHGVYVNVQYSIACDMQRPMLNKNVRKAVEFIVEAVPEEKGFSIPKQPFQFSIAPSSLQNVRKASKHKIPDFLFEGKLESTVCNLNEAFVGELTIKSCAVDIKSIELQLVRVETCTYLEGEAREATEIQNIQLADGNIVHNLTIPIYMVFPRLFTCCTTLSKNFKLEFEVNLIILFTDNHMVTENFPIKLYRV